ncbi:hypothetical protein DI43_12315 [Geobacillus sp. CAMR12739]|nr:hypothetical protein DI43_12315 [Geobacillus sp. CAMR12739]
MTEKPLIEFFDCRGQAFACLPSRRSNAQLKATNAKNFKLIKKTQNHMAEHKRFLSLPSNKNAGGQMSFASKAFIV